jgi:hypothetical protein
MAITINYLYPVAGTTPPTPIQVANMVIATVQGSAASDTSAAITHDFGLPASDISSGFPEVEILQQANELTQGIWELSENPNFTVLGVSGIVGPVKVFIKRPHTIVR